MLLQWGDRIHRPLYLQQWQGPLIINILTDWDNEPKFISVFISNSNRHTIVLSARYSTRVDFINILHGYTLAFYNRAFLSIAHAKTLQTPDFLLLLGIKHIRKYLYFKHDVVPLLKDTSTGPSVVLKRDQPGDGLGLPAAPPSGAGVMRPRSGQNLCTWWYLVVLGDPGMNLRW